jgi:tryptophanyl-tRNA synthetase
MSSKQLVFSGVQPTGNLHLGNYLGALKNFVYLQKDAECIYCVVDLHAITTFQSPATLKKNTLETTASFIASGLDEEKSIIFNQSAVSGHAELAWILNCISRIGWLNRMTQFKDKAGKDKEKASVGLYIYPNLMAADILLYKSTHVPVGADQKQHLELSRDIALKFNRDFKCENFFPLPEPLIQKNISRVMSLRDGNKKMSKSEESDYSRINLKDNADIIVKKIKKAKTDSAPIPESEEELVKRPEALNLINIYAYVSNTTLKSVLKIMSGKEFSYFKNQLAEVLISEICPIGKKIEDLMNNQSHLEAILKKGKEKAEIKSEENLKKIREIVGLI